MDAFGWLLHNKSKYLIGTAEWFLCADGCTDYLRASWVDCLVVEWLTGWTVG
jgi:hypothetical protein